MQLRGTGEHRRSFKQHQLCCCRKHQAEGWPAPYCGRYAFLKNNSLRQLKDL